MFDRPILTAFVIAALLLVGLFLAVRYCGAPQVVPAGSNNLVMVCLFPLPWSYLFGARPTYVFNLYVLAGIPLVIFLLAWIWSLLNK